MEVPGKGFSFAGTKKMPADRTEKRLFPNMFGIKINLFGSFGNLKTSDLS
jgi:hypothetical protein